MGLRRNCVGEGAYGLPGGHLEYGERLIDGAKRELKEECGITATEIKYNSIIDEKLPDKVYIQINFVVSQFSGEIKCLEKDKCEVWEWYDLESLPENIFPPHVLIIEAFKQNKIYLY